MKRALCRLAGLALILPALTSSLIVAMLVGTADERIGKDRFYLHCFEAAAGVRPLPPMHLARAADRFGPAYAQCPAISERPSLDPEDADVEDRIARQPHDRLWGFWRGEWKEYFVSPSGGTSLLATKILYWRAFAPQILVYLLISGVCIVAARRFWLRSSQSIPGTSSVSGT